MRIIQISDSHLSLEKPERARELEACVRYINTIEPQPDVVVHTGDVAHDGHIEEYALARELLNELSAPYFVMAGNRDNRANLIQTFADGEHLRLDMPFVQYSVDAFDVQLVMADTMSTTSNKGNLCESRRAHLRELLKQDASKPTILFLHHPPFLVGVGPEPRNFEDWSIAEALLIELNGHDHIRGIFCGHVHRAFETSVGEVPARVVSCVVSDLRWDQSRYENLEHPIFATHTVTAAL